MYLKILAYNQTYNELRVQSNLRRYTYEGVSPYLYHKVNYYISKRWFGKAWQLLRKLKMQEN